ncbi:MAG: Flp family type IVb pilin [Robiginitomaculum sp.]|nr:MAG: Flp family type IVb pilin [Robiginitomaculum sp.]
MKQGEKLQRMFSQFLACERGHTAIEYGLILALIFLVIVGAFTHFSEVATEKLLLANDAIVGAG